MKAPPWIALLLVPSIACASWEAPPAHVPDVDPELALYLSTPEPAVAAHESPEQAPGTTPAASPPGEPTEAAVAEAGSTDPTSTDDVAPHDGLILPSDGLKSVDEAQDHDAAFPRSAKAQRARSGVFWAGVALSALGGASFVATSIGGRVTQKQLADGYNDLSLTHSREQQLRDRGDIFNNVAIAGITTAVVGVMMLSVALGLDYAHCGKLTRRSRKDCHPR